jgi:hypothetical protein
LLDNENFLISRDEVPFRRPRRRFRWLTVAGLVVAIIAAAAEVVVAAVALMQYLGK